MSYSILSRLMKNAHLRRYLRESEVRERGAAALELALILPILLIVAFGIIDLGRLIQARLIITNVSREGGSLASRTFKSGSDLLNILQASGSPLDLNGSGKIYVFRILAGTSLDEPDPFIDKDNQFSKGNLNVGSQIRGDIPRLGLSEALYQHLKFEGPPQNTSDIVELWVVEVYYNYRPITPLPNFIKNILITPGYGGSIIGSKAVF